MDATTLLHRWREDLEAWAIPDEILARAEESPWVLPHAVFDRRAERRMREPGGPSRDRAAEALPAGGSVLDVGAGAGAASLALRPRAGAIAAVDENDSLLRALAEHARPLGVEPLLIEGRWPDVAADAPVADVVTCHHVLYNVPDLEPFVTALTAHARRRVVVEITDRHPLTALNPLWRRFHDLERPEGPTADDAYAVLDRLGLNPRSERFTRSAGAEYESFDELVDVTRRRVCLPLSRAAEVAEALRDLGVDPEAPQDLGSSGREIVTIWWGGTAV